MRERMSPMRRTKGRFVMAGWKALAVAPAGSAEAADLPPVPKLPAPEAEEFSGWYLRGDLGLGVAAARPELQNVPNPVATGVSAGLLSPAASQAFNNTTLSSFGMIDARRRLSVQQLAPHGRHAGILRRRQSAIVLHTDRFGLAGPRRPAAICGLLSRRRFVGGRAHMNMRGPPRIRRRCWTRR